MKNMKNVVGEIKGREYIEDKEQREQEQGREQEEEVEFEAGTLADFIEYLKKRHKESDSMEEKQDINRHKLNIILGLQSADLDAKTIKVKVLPDGVLGACAVNESDKPIMISQGFLEDFKSSQAEITAVLVHENIHHEGIDDEGLTMIKTKKEVANSPEAYTAEQGQARRTFAKLTVEKALNLYDLDNPEKLINDWLQLEIKEKYENKTDDLKRIHASKRSLESHVDNNALLMKSYFKKGAEALFKKAESRDFSMTREIRKILKKMGEEALNEKKKK